MASNLIRKVWDGVAAAVAIEVVVAVAVAMVARLVGLRSGGMVCVCVCVDTLDVVGYVVELKNAS